MELTFDALAARTGYEYAFSTTGGPVTLLLTEARPHPGGHPGGELIFSGPSEQPLDQGTYDVAGEGVSGPLFVVPVADVAGTRTYQAVFA